MNRHIAFGKRTLRFSNKKLSHRFHYNQQRFYQPISIPSTQSIDRNKETRDVFTSQIDNEMEQVLHAVYVKAEKLSQIARQKRKLITNIVEVDFQSTLEKNRLRSRPLSSQHLAEIKEETKAVETLLSMTSHESFYEALVQQRSKSYGKRSCTSTSLHSAFISIINWLSSTLLSLPSQQSYSKEVNFIHEPVTSLTSKESMLLSHILHLTERSHELNLPLSIPQYKVVLTIIAKHASSSGDISAILLGVASNVKEMYGDTSKGELNPVNSNFFSGALKELLRRNLFRDAVNLLHGMNHSFQIEQLELSLGIELLNDLKETIDNSITGKKKLGPEFDEMDAMEFAMMLQEPVMRELKSKQSELETSDDKSDSAVGTVMDHNRQEDQENWDDAFDEMLDDVDKYMSDNPDKIDELEKDLQELNDIVKSMELGNDEKTQEQARNTAKIILDKINSSKVHKETKEVEASSNGSIDDNLLPRGFSAKVQMDPSTGEMQNLVLIYDPNKASPELEKTQKEKNRAMQQDLINDLIYCRDNSWEIPDIVSQLEKWNQDRQLLFSKTFERDLAREIMNDDEFLNFDDDDDGEEERKDE